MKLFIFLTHFSVVELSPACESVVLKVWCFLKWAVVKGRNWHEGSPREEARRRWGTYKLLEGFWREGVDVLRLIQQVPESQLALPISPFTLGCRGHILPQEQVGQQQQQECPWYKDLPHPNKTRDWWGYKSHSVKGDLSSPSALCCTDWYIWAGEGEETPSTMKI